MHHRKLGMPRPHKIGMALPHATGMPIVLSMDIFFFEVSTLDKFSNLEIDTFFWQFYRATVTTVTTGTTVTTVTNITTDLLSVDGCVVSVDDQ
jgi:hypothetical protein